MRVPKEFKIRYLQRRTQEIPELMCSIDNGDFGFAERVGHQLKGNAVTFEIPQIAYIGLEMERAAQKKDLDKLRALIQKLQTSLDSVRGHWLGDDFKNE
jgi:HPt (histidine-containing phosphotransfer) domain-containing protein